MKLIVILSLTVLISCNTKQSNENEILKSQNNEISKIDKSNIEVSNVNFLETEILETFVDSLNIGEKGKCKVELIKYRIYYDNYVIIKFYIKGRNRIKDAETWMIQNNYSYETNAIMSFETNFSDFNNDKLNDMTFVSKTAARGSNEVRRLFVYDDKKRKLLSIVNSEEYPNMLFNKELDCIDAFLVSGTTTTVFAEISGDSLRKFARVHNGIDYNTIELVDKNGNYRELYKVESKAIGVRFKNFRPLIEY